MVIVNSLVDKPFLMIVQGEHGKLIQFDNTIHLQGEWEVALPQL